MSIYTPPANWFQKPKGAERLWVGLALIWCMIMFLAMPYWHFFGKQNSTGEGYKVTPAAYSQRVQQFIASNKVGDVNGMPVVEPAPGGDAYLQAQMWTWLPILKLRMGQTYRIHLSSMDLLHGFSLQPLNMNFMVLPGYDHVLTITPTTSGEFSIVCNEFCGVGHHLMSGRIIVEE